MTISDRSIQSSAGTIDEVSEDGVGCSDEPMTSVELSLFASKLALLGRLFLSCLPCLSTSPWFGLLEPLLVSFWWIGELELEDPEA